MAARILYMASDYEAPDRPASRPLWLPPRMYPDDGPQSTRRAGKASACLCLSGTWLSQIATNRVCS